MSAPACTALLQKEGRRIQCERPQGHYRGFLREGKLSWPSAGNPRPDGWHASGRALWGDFSRGALPDTQEQHDGAGPVRPDEEQA